MNTFKLFNSIKKWYHHKPMSGKQVLLIVFGAFAGLMLLILLLNVPIVTLATETLEPYYVTETSYQPYTSTEYVVTETSVQKNMVIANGYYTVVPSGVIIPFLIDRPGSRLTGVFDNTIPGSFLIYNSSNHIIWEKLGNRGNIDLILPPGNYRAKFQENLMWGEQVYIYLAIGWNEIEQGTIEQKISRYREVPVVVSKDRTVLKKDAYSIWELISAFYYRALKRS